MQDFSPLVPDLLTPGQFFDRHRNADTPVKRLLFAILDISVRDAIGAGQWGRRYKRDALAWVDDADDAGIFSFRSICDALAIDPTQLRARLRSGSVKKPPRRTEGRAAHRDKISRALHSHARMR